MSRLILNEDIYAPNTIFVDSSTGKEYTWNGSEFVERKQPKPSKDKNKNSGDPSNQEQGSKNDSEDGDRQKSSSPSTPHGPQIGDRPDENDEESKRIEDEEERQRQAEDDPRYESDEEARLQRIQDILDNPEDQAALNDENFRKVSKSRETRKEAQKRRERELKKYQDAQGIEGFVASITDFIKNEVKQQTIRTYSKLNKTYNSNTGPIIRRGKMTKKNDKIPKINVYYDQSASWSDEDIKVGNAAIASLNQYVKKKQLIIDIYYFANRVSSNNSTSEIGGGTKGAPVIEHINQTRPDNVVIMTDSDTYYNNGPSATVPGGVWFLWKNGEKSKYFIDSLHGKKLTKQFDIKSGK